MDCTEQAAEHYGCCICLKLLFMPVTTVCGHSFCKGCLHQSLEHKLKCPLCNRALPPYRSEFSVSVILEHALQSQFPALYAARAGEEADERFGGVL